MASQPNWVLLLNHMLVARRGHQTQLLLNPYVGCYTSAPKQSTSKLQCMIIMLV